MSEKEKEEVAISLKVAGCLMIDLVVGCRKSLLLVHTASYVGLSLMGGGTGGRYNLIFFYFFLVLLYFVASCSQPLYLGG